MSTPPGDAAPTRNGRRGTPRAVWIVAGGLAVIAVGLTATVTAVFSGEDPEPPSEDRDPTEEEEYRLLQEIGYVK